jgi:sugar/nucleoside kinase (ribokinase family)
VATITSAGQEPTAALAVTELAALGPSRASDAEASIHYAIGDADGRRRLTYEGGGSALTVTPIEVAEIDPRAVLLAPIGAELGVEAIGACSGVPVRIAALQGWLRGLTAGESVRPLRLDALDDDLVAALADLDGLVASDEDLAAVAAEPRQQVARLRQRIGPHPFLLITAGVAGAWLDDPASGQHQLPVPRRLRGASPVGAGDALAAFLAVGLAAGHTALDTTQAAMVTTADFLATRAG